MRINLFHHHVWPTEAPPWVADLKRQLGLVLQNQDKQMSLEQDLDSAVSALAKGYGDLHDAVAKQTDALTKALQSVPQTDPAATQAMTDAIANITAITGKMATDAADLTAAVPAATTVDSPQVSQPASTPTADVPSIEVPPITDPNATPPDQSSSISSGPAA